MNWSLEAVEAIITSYIQLMKEREQTTTSIQTQYFKVDNNAKEAVITDTNDI